MREIKFRAWDKINKRWIRLWKLYLAVTGELMAVGDIEGGVYGLHQIELMQYTGLKDKNGKEIYEGDILKTDKGIICRVYWSTSGASFMISYLNIWTGQIGRLIYKKLMNWHAKSEVIGTIYENPEL